MTEEFGLSNSTGMWNVIKAIDIEKDGDLDIIGGNMGANTFLKSNMRIYINDFDKNGVCKICHKDTDTRDYCYHVKKVRFWGLCDC